MPEKGRIKDNDFLICGNVPGFPRPGYFPQKLGETTRYNAPSGKTLFAFEMLRDGTGLVFRRPGVPGEHLLGSSEPVSSVAVSFREDDARPWRELARVSAADDSVAGVLSVTTTADDRSVTETIRYNPDTGALLNEGRPERDARSAIGPVHRPFFRLPVTGNAN